MDPEHHRLLAVMHELLRLLEKAPPGTNVQVEVEAAVGRIVEISLGVLRKEWSRVKRLD